MLLPFTECLVFFPVNTRRSLWPLHPIQSRNALYSLNKIQSLFQMVAVLSKWPHVVAMQKGSCWHRTWKTATITVVLATTTVICSFHRDHPNMRYACLHVQAGMVTHVKNIYILASFQPTPVQLRDPLCQWVADCTGEGWAPGNYGSSNVTDRHPLPSCSLIWESLKMELKEHVTEPEGPENR